MAPRIGRSNAEEPGHPRIRPPYQSAPPRPVHHPARLFRDLQAIDGQNPITRASLCPAHSEVKQE